MLVVLEVLKGEQQFLGVGAAFQHVAEDDDHRAAVDLFGDTVQGVGDHRLAFYLGGDGTQQFLQLTVDHLLVHVAAPRLRVQLESVGEYAQSDGIALVFQHLHDGCCGIDGEKDLVGRC